MRTVTTSDFEPLKNAYRENFIEKEFVYKSKYGGITKMKIKDFLFTTVISLDEKAAWKFSKKISERGKGSPPKGPQPEVDFEYRGYNLKIEVISQNGNFYNFNEICIL